MGKKKVKGSIKKLHPQIREMHNQGMSPQEIGDSLGLARQQIQNALFVLGLTQPRPTIDESKLIYADNRPPVLEKVIIDGKLYTDITPLFSPR